MVMQWLWLLCHNMRKKSSLQKLTGVYVPCQQLTCTCELTISTSTLKICKKLDILMFYQRMFWRGLFAPLICEFKLLVTCMEYHPQIINKSRRLGQSCLFLKLETTNQWLYLINHLNILTSKILNLLVGSTPLLPRLINFLLLQLQCNTNFLLTTRTGMLRPQLWLHVALLLALVPYPFINCQPKVWNGPNKIKTKLYSLHLLTTVIKCSKKCS